MKTNEQLEKAAEIVLGSLKAKDKTCIASIAKVPALARHNYAISIWAGIVDRHAVSIAEKSEGAVVIKTAAQREQLAEFLFVRVSNGQAA